MLRNTPLVIMDDATAGPERLLCFQDPKAVIAASRAEDVPAALALLEHALAGGSFVAGWFGYEMGYALEPRLGPVPAMPLLWFGIFDKPKPATRADLGRPAAAYAGPLRHDWDEAQYAVRFDKVRDYIAAGDIYQANLSFRSRFRFVGDPLGLYLRLRRQSAAAHGAYIDDGDRQILSLSPELFFEIDARRRIVARPMKGTAPRGGDELSDARAKAALAASPKDRAENLMIVDLVRNDIGRLALIGSVAVDRLFEVETYPTLHTMVSTVHATLRPGIGVRDVVRALFPCGSVTGAPKIRAMEIIRELEQGPRGLYCGAIGYFAPDGSAKFNVAIRTIAIANGEGVLGIGGAVVQDSTAPSEYAECLLKARYFTADRPAIGLIETLRHESGFIRRDRHLDRMAASAQVLSLPFDRTLAIAALDSAVVGAREALRVRLTLDEDGAFACTAAPLGLSAAHWTYSLSPHPVRSDDTLLRHKTTWRAFYDAEHLRLASETGCDEALFVNERGELTEGSRTNVFLRRHGRLFTPPLSCGLLDGVLRRELLETGQCEEAVLTPADLAGADEILLGNSLRGLIPATAVTTVRAAG